MSTPLVRDAVAADVLRLTEIYNYYIVNTAITFDIEPFTVEQRMEWFSHYGLSGPYRLLVAEQDGLVLGSAWSSPYRPKRAYETTVETSVYCAPEATGQGLGRLLYGALFEALAGEKQLHRAIGAITEPNEASVALHERFGFQRIAVFTEIGRKFDRYWDVAFFEKELPGAGRGSG